MHELFLQVANNAFPQHQLARLPCFLVAKRLWYLRLAESQGDDICILLTALHSAIPLLRSFQMFFLTDKPGVPVHKYVCIRHACTPILGTFLIF